MNLQALIRYRTIDRCLHNREYAWTWETIAEACMQALEEHMGRPVEISKRTIMYDIQHMRSGILGYNAPIAYDRKEKTYYYEDPKFSINHVPIKDQEFDELKEALSILKQFGGREKVRGLEEVITKLEETLRIRAKRKPREIIQFHHSLNEPGQKWLNQLYSAIQDRRTLMVKYQPFGSKPDEYVISPYLLKEYQGRWFLFALRHGTPWISNLALDRIKDLRDALPVYEESENFDAKTYLRDIIGVSIPPEGKVVDVVFKVLGKQKEYFRTKPIHESQQLIEDTNEYATFKLSVIPNYELEREFLSRLDEVEVLVPYSLRARITERATSGLKHLK